MRKTNGDAGNVNHFRKLSLLYFYSNSDSGDSAYSLFWEPDLFTETLGASNSGWIFGYSSCSKDYRSCNKVRMKANSIIICKL